jgi:hypothetical protein
LRLRWGRSLCPHREREVPRPGRLAVTAGSLGWPDSVVGFGVFPVRRVIAQARLAPVRAWLTIARPGGWGVLTGDGVVRFERFSDRPAVTPAPELPGDAHMQGDARGAR